MNNVKTFTDVDQAVETIMKEAPFPQMEPQAPDSLLLDQLREREKEYTASIADLDQSISIMQDQRAAYSRARQRVQAAINLEVKGQIDV